MKNIKFGMKLGVIAWAGVSTYKFCTALEHVLLKRVIKKLDGVIKKLEAKEAEDAEKKEQAAEDFEDFLR